MRNKVSFAYSGSGFDKTLMTNILKSHNNNIECKVVTSGLFNGRFYAKHKDKNFDLFSIAKKYASHAVIDNNQ